MNTLRIVLLAGVAAVTVAGPANPANRARATADRPKIMEGRSVWLPNHGRPTFPGAKAVKAEPKCFGQQTQDRFDLKLLDAALTLGTLGLWDCLPEGPLAANPPEANFKWRIVP